MSIAFKEWALVCEALGRGDQSVIIRKGGIAEGRDGFQFKHPSFFLFPTLFHEQLERTVLPLGTPLPHLDPLTVKIELYAEVKWTALVSDWEVVARLAPFHIWREEIVAERFRYDEPQGVHVALLRVHRLAKPWTFPNSSAFGGCRSWLDLPEIPAEIGWSPVIDNAKHAKLAGDLRAAMSLSA